MAFSNTERLRRFYGQFSGKDQVLIVINADPDSIASAMAVKRLLWRKVGEVVMVCINRVDRPDNEAMVELLKVDLKRGSDVDFSRFDKKVLIDSQPSHHPRISKHPYDVIIDHHPPDPQLDAPFKDIRPQYGATASIMCEYIKTARIRPNRRLATALVYAIKTDTSNFERRAINEDVKAFQYLYKFVNVNVIKKIEKTGIRGKYLKYFEKALRNRQRSGNNLITYLNNVSSPDICVIIADFYMTVDFVSWCYVAGIHQKKLIIIIRNDGIRKNAGRLAKKKFGSLGSAGGHKSMARAEIPLETLQPLCDTDSEEAVKKWLVRRIKKP